jgi:hypothetical protein
MQTTRTAAIVSLPRMFSLPVPAKGVLRAALLLALSLALAGSATAADVVFTASGGFLGPDGTYPLSGTITINTATGKVVSVDLTASASGFSPLTFTSTLVTEEIGDDFIRVTIREGADELSLTFPVATLVGYAGGPLVQNFGPARPGYERLPDAIVTSCSNGEDFAVLVEGSLKAE